MTTKKRYPPQPQPYRKEIVSDTGEQPALRVWWGHDDGVSYYAVKDIAEAKVIINRLTAADLSDDSVGWNIYGLEEREEDGDGEYHEWYDHGLHSISDIMDEEGGD